MKIWKPQGDLPFLIKPKGQTFPGFNDSSCHGWITAGMKNEPVDNLSHNRVESFMFPISSKMEQHQKSANGTNGSNDTGPYLFLEHEYGWMIVTAVIIGLAAVIGSLGNILIILAVCCVRTLRTCGNVFVLNLSLADMIVTVLIDPFNVVGAIAGRSILIDNPMLCDWIASFCSPACASSMWNMCAISLNRYVLICKPHLYPKIFTFKTTILCCISIWILAHLIHLPNHVGWGHSRFSTDYYICTFDTYTHSYGAFYIGTAVVIPLVGVLFGYSAIFLKVRSVKMQIRHHQNALSTAAKVAPRTDSAGNIIIDANESKKKRPQKPGFTVDDVKLAKTLFAAFLVFLVCWLPFALFVAAHDPKEIPPWLYVIAIIMAHGNSAVNPILYGMTNEKFREGYRTVLGLNRRVEDKTTKGRSGVTYGHDMMNLSKTDGESSRIRNSIAPILPQKPSIVDA